jgi:hypothetical protein
MRNIFIHNCFGSPKSATLAVIFAERRMLLVFASRWMMEGTQPVCKYSNPAQNKIWIQNISNKLITYELIIFVVGQFLSLIK